jgi:NAD(P)-dependent dehydrogenase (short-subunit alcohol dehydrogenase family)
MADKTLKDKKIIISAGASGIGWATAKVCLSKGASVFICDVNKKYLAKVKKHPMNKKKLFIYECDASNEYEVKELFKLILKKTKKIDCLINNVGISGPTGTIEKLNSEDWENTLKTNVISHFYFTKLVIPMLKKIKVVQ